MSIFSPRAVLQSQASLLAACGSCGHQVIFPEHNADLDDVLIDATYLRSLYREQSFLDHTASLFARFPESRHALKVNKEQLHPKLLPRTGKDLEFEAALAGDPELSFFLRRSSFHLPSRRRLVTRLIAELEAKDFSVIQCPVCTEGTLRLPDGFLRSCH